MMNDTLCSFFCRAFTVVAFVVLLDGCKTPPPKKPEVKQEAIFFPPPPDEARIQFLCNFHGTMDFARPQAKGSFWEWLVGLPPAAADFTVVKPYGLAMLNHKLFLSDTEGSLIGIFDLKNEEAELFGRSGRGALKKPVNIRIGPDHLLYVADTGRRQVVVFNEDGRYVTEYGDGKTIRPVDVLPTDNEIYVLNVIDNKMAEDMKDNAQNIKVFDRKTHAIKNTIGKRGQGEGMFTYPNSLAGDKDGNVYVCDAMNFRIEKFDSTGKLLHTFGSAGDTAGTFARPRGLAIDRSGIIYVIDSKSHVVQLFDKDGRILMFFGGFGEEDGRLFLPAQIIVDYDHVADFKKYIDPSFDAEYLILVSNQFGPNKVSVFAFGHLRTQADVPAAPKPGSPTPATTPAPAPAAEKK